ncbi:MAG: hypothetical protein M1838_002450 [Thelocarpon superellum]|nr:MAG: hypothetical protein M1838_002450 [Thelocarpon superellum]
MEPIIQSTVKKVAVIGAGPSGIAAAKYLHAEGAFDHIDVFEQRHTVGGAWNDAFQMSDQRALEPQRGPHGPVEEPHWSQHPKQEGDPLFMTPMYFGLETNIPTFMMQYSDLPFPPETSLFPRQREVLNYLEEYAKEVQSLIRFTTQILDVRACGAPDADGWTVTTKQLRSGVETTTHYDAVAVANGHFDVPNIPDIPGLGEWQKAYRDSVIHSKYFRSYQDWKNKRVVLVGNAASGTDIGAQIGRVCAKPLVVSRRTPSFFTAGPEPWKQERPEITELIPAGRIVRFADGTELRDVDSIIFCTGYLYSYPFLESLEPPLISDGGRTQHVFQQVFYTPDPTLAFLTLPQRITPFCIAEGQSGWIARVWSKRLGLPPQYAREGWEEERMEEEAEMGRKFHVLGFPEEVDYINYLHILCLRAEPPEGGKLPRHWDRRMRWARKRAMHIRAAYRARGPEREEVTTMEELGFDPTEEDLNEADGDPLPPLVLPDPPTTRSSTATTPRISVPGLDTPNEPMPTTQTLDDGQPSDSSSQSAGVPSHSKRRLEDEGMDGMPIKMRRLHEMVQSQAPKDASSDRAVLRPISRVQPALVAAPTPRERALESQLAYVQARLDEHIEQMSVRQYQYEGLVDDFRDMRRQRDAAQATTEDMLRLNASKAAEAKRMAERCASLQTDLSEAQVRLERSTVPGVAELEGYRSAAHQATSEAARLKERLDSLTADFDFTRAQYQQASTAAAEATMELETLREEQGTLKAQASGETAKVRGMTESAAVEQHLQRIRQLELLLADREELLRRKDDDLKTQLRARGMGTRASSRSPQPHVRPKSPNAGTAVRVAHALRYGENL